MGLTNGSAFRRRRFGKLRRRLGQAQLAHTSWGRGQAWQQSERRPKREATGFLPPRLASLGRGVGSAPVTSLLHEATKSNRISPFASLPPNQSGLEGGRGGTKPQVSLSLLGCSLDCRCSTPSVRPSLCPSSLRPPSQVILRPFGPATSARSIFRPSDGRRTEERPPNATNRRPRHKAHTQKYLPRAQGSANRPLRGPGSCEPARRLAPTTALCASDLGGAGSCWRLQAQLNILLHFGAEAADSRQGHLPSSGTCGGRSRHQFTDSAAWPLTRVLESSPAPCGQ